MLASRRSRVRIPPAARSGRPALRRCGALLAASDGAAMVELAISLPFLAFVTAASVAVMQIITAQFGVQAAAREAAIVGASISSSINPLGRAEAEALEEVQRVLAEYNLDIALATVTFDDNDPLLQRGGFFQVQVAYDVPLLELTIPFFAELAGGTVESFKVQARSVMPIQLHRARWPCPSPHPICP